MPTLYITKKSPKGGDFLSLFLFLFLNVVLGLSATESSGVFIKNANFWAPTLNTLNQNNWRRGPGNDYFKRLQSNADATLLT